MICGIYARQALFNLAVQYGLRGNCGQMIKEMKEAIEHLAHRRQHVCVHARVCEIRLSPHLG